MNRSRIKFTASSIAWTEGGVMHMHIKASAGSDIKIRWGDGRTITHSFRDESEMVDFKHDYFPKLAIPPSNGILFHVEITGIHSDCRIIGFRLGGDMKANDLDLKNCTELEELSLDIDTGCSSVDVSCNTALKYLSFRGMGIESLDLSNNIALKELYCFSNRLKYLSLTNNIDLEYFNCEFNEMEKIFIYYAPQLRCAEFEEGNNIDNDTRSRIQQILEGNNIENE